MWSESIQKRTKSPWPSVQLSYNLTVKNSLIFIFLLCREKARLMTRNSVIKIQNLVMSQLVKSSPGFAFKFNVLNLIVQDSFPITAKRNKNRAQRKEKELDSSRTEKHC